MKRKNKKLLTLMVASALCATTLGGVAGLMNSSVSAYSPEDPKTYSLTSVFSAKSTAKIGAEKLNDADTAETATFTLAKDDSVEFNRDLAFKWYEAQDKEKKGEVRYMNIDFAFGDMKFNKISFIIETDPAQATVSGESVNTIQFVRDAETGAISAGVLYGEETDTTGFVAINAEEKQVLSLTLSEENASYGEFKVFVGETEIGTMTNVGGNFADTSDVDTLVIKADVNGSDTTKLYLANLNKQSFNNIAEKDGTKMVADNAAPVLVVNEDLSGFLLGTAFNLEYEKIDVLKSSSLSETKKYYQYNPADGAPSYDNTLTTSTYFMDTVYYYNEADGTYSKEAKEGYVSKSVYRENDFREFISIQFQLGDETFTGDHKVTYDLSWYVDEADLVEKTQTTTGENATETKTKFIVLDRNEEGPTYNYITIENEENKVVEGFEAEVEAYEALLAENAESVYAGKNAEIQLPAVDWLISDNNGYQALSFTISYYKPNSTTASTSSSLSYNKLELATTVAGMYEFKIFAKDKAGNAMKYYLDNELVEVTSSNIWDIEEIPSFRFTITDQGIKVDTDEDKDTIDTQILNEKYTYKDVTIVGATSEASAYKLYTVDMDAYNSKLSGDATRLTTGILSGIKYASLQSAVKDKIPTVEGGDYFKLYKEAYVNAIAKALGASEAADIENLNACIQEVEEFDDRISEEENEEAWNASDNKYEWNSANKSFMAADEGVYLILADYWDTELAYVDRVMAYKLVEVDAKADVIKGETEWLKNNIVSVILFSIAAVMLILIIILLLIKPTDETLEDVDAKALKAKKSKKE